MAYHSIHIQVVLVLIVHGPVPTNVSVNNIPGEGKRIKSEED